jgi:hypothetical protein
MTRSLMQSSYDIVLKGNAVIDGAGKHFARSYALPNNFIARRNHPRAANTQGAG